LGLSFQIFKDATLFFSCANTSIATVIPVMDHIDSVLTSVIITSSSKKHKLLPSIKAALAIRKRMLNRYYDKTDHSEVFRIAMSEFSLLLDMVY